MSDGVAHRFVGLAEVPLARATHLPPRAPGPGPGAGLAVVRPASAWAAAPDAAVARAVPLERVPLGGRPHYPDAASGSVGLRVWVEHATVTAGPAGPPGGPGARPPR